MAIAYKNNMRTKALNDVIGQVEAAVMNEVTKPDYLLEKMRNLSGSSNDAEIRLFAKGYSMGAEVPTKKLDLLLESLKLKNTIKGVNK